LPIRLFEKLLYFITAGFLVHTVNNCAVKFQFQAFAHSLRCKYFCCKQYE